jgi:hypothetical protein
LSVVLQSSTWTHLSFRDTQPIPVPALLKMYYDRSAGDVRFLDLSRSNISNHEVIAVATSPSAYAWKLVHLDLSSCWCLSPISLMCISCKFWALRILNIQDMASAAPEVARVAASAVVNCSLLEALDISHNEVRYLDLKVFFSRLKGLAINLTQLGARNVSVLDYPIESDAGSRLWGKVNGTSLSHVDITGSAMTTGLFLQIIAKNECLSDLRMDDLFTKPGRPTVLDCTTLRRKKLVRDNVNRRDGDWPVSFADMHELYRLQVPRYRENSEETMLACVKGQSLGWVIRSDA